MKKPPSSRQVLANRRNAARSGGPRSAGAKARVAGNALRHGLTAQRHVAVPGENVEEMRAFEKALMADLAPEGALEQCLAERIVAALWRARRADRTEGEVLRHQATAVPDFVPLDTGLLMIRDANGPRAMDTVVRYRSATMSEIWRLLRALKALQAARTAAPEA